MSEGPDVQCVLVEGYQMQCWDCGDLGPVEDYIDAKARTSEHRCGVSS